MKRSIRLADVAELAGVSLGTASNAFNRPDLVRPEVRELVEKAARKLGYSGPDPKGRLLMGGKANAIGVLPPGDMTVTHAMRSPFFRDFLQGVSEICDENNANVLMVSGTEDRKVWSIRNALVDGFILGHVEEVGLISVRNRKVPFVVMDMDAGPATRSVRIEARKGARLAAEHLLGLGHRQFAIVSVLRKPADPVWHPPNEPNRQLTAGYLLDREKLLGYGDALETAGIPIGTVPVVEFHPATPFVEAGARALFDSATAATAFLVMSDVQAIAILAEAKRRKIKVPRDISVVGFDGVSTAAYTEPPLTTVAQPLFERGRVAARMLFDAGSPRHVCLPVELIVRSSTAARPSKVTARRA